MDIRPRSAGEILDDAWALVFADAPALLALSGLFTVPLATVLLLLLTLPEAMTEPYPLLLPALFALLLPLTGLGSGACQAWFRARSEGRAISLTGCVIAALRRGLTHITVRTLLFGLVFLAVLFFLLPFTIMVRPQTLFSFVFKLDGPSLLRMMFMLGTLVVAYVTSAAVGGGMVHPLVADGKESWYASWRAALRQTRRQGGKVALVMVTRPFMLLFACVNGLTFIILGLWAVDHFAGVDVALAERVVTPVNPVFVVSVGLLAWLLLVPYFEASNYLLHADDRARYEGLDLWYRVRRLFPAPAASAKVLLLLLGLLLFATPVQADGRRDALAQARKEVARITREVKDTEDYSNGRRWGGDLTRIGERLDRNAGNQEGRFRWFEQAVTEFPTATKERALKILAELDRRLALVEESLPPEEDTPTPLTKEQLRGLLPKSEPLKREKRPETKKEPPKEEPVRSNPPPRVMRQGPGLVGPAATAGLSMMGWVVLGVLFAAVVALAVWFSWTTRRKSAKPPAAKTTAVNELSLEALLSQPGQAIEHLWQQADNLARAGNYLEAVRILYLAVLTFLHRNNLIRCASTRTNGEYIAQLRSQQTICQPFRGLTGMFELKWYGERACQSADYDSCRQLAETIREEVKVP
jgi:hypothetical protein